MLRCFTHVSTRQCGHLSFPRILCPMLRCFTNVLTCQCSYWSFSRILSSMFRCFTHASTCQCSHWRFSSAEKCYSFWLEFNRYFIYVSNTYKVNAWPLMNSLLDPLLSAILLTALIFQSLK